MSFGSSLVNDFIKMRSAIAEARPVNQIVEPSVLPSSIAPGSNTSTATKVSRKRKEMRTTKRTPSEDVKTLLESDPLGKKEVELYFLNKLLRLISAEED
jgi:hypothetical protein